MQLSCMSRLGMPSTPVANVGSSDRPKPPNIQIRPTLDAVSFGNRSVSTELTFVFICKTAVDAGNAYEKAAYVYEQLNEPDSAARHRLDAFTALRKTAQWQQGVQNLEKAIQHNSSSNINRAADNQKKLGEFWEEKGGKGTENQNPEFLRLAVEAFAKAGGWYLQTGMDA